MMAWVMDSTIMAGPIPGCIPDTMVMDGGITIPGDIIPHGIFTVPGGVVISDGALPATTDMAGAATTIRIIARHIIITTVFMEITMPITEAEEAFMTGIQSHPIPSGEGLI